MTKKSDEPIRGENSYYPGHFYYNKKKKLGKKRYMFDIVSNKHLLE